MPHPASLILSDQSDGVRLAEDTTSPEVLSSVVVLGHRGMLGSVVTRWLREQGHEVATTDLRWPDSLEFAVSADVVIDCMRGGWEVDAEAPIVLGYRCRHLIVPSTDAWREPTEYARAKRAAEMAKGVIIRAGIVDVERQPQRAYTDWRCDPLTPLEWIRQAWALRDSPGLHELGRHVIDRWTLALHVARVWGRRVWPDPAQGGPLDRVVVGQGGIWIGDALEEYRAWLQS